MTKHAILAAAALSTAAAPAFAVGLDRSGQNITAIFAEDNTASFSIIQVNPEVTGEDLAGGGSYDTSVGRGQIRPQFNYTGSLSEDFNFAFIADAPYGANVNYDADPLTTALGGTTADLDSSAFTFIGRYKLGGGFSVFGGMALQTVGADVSLNGTAYASAISTSAVTRTFNAGLPAGVPQLDSSTLGAALLGDPAAAASIDGTYGAGTTTTLGTSVGTTVAGFNASGGYTFDMENSNAPNFLIGAAYEIPSIALRISGTYRFETEHSADVTETLLGTTTTGSVDYVTPASFNLDFQTGIAPGTLLTASYRWTDFTAIEVIPPTLGQDLVEREDGHRYTLGIGRQFSDKLAGSALLIYEPEVSSDLVSPLDPITSNFGVGLGARFTDGPLQVTGGAFYSWLGDSRPEVGGTAVASFEDNYSVSYALQLSYQF